MSYGRCESRVASLDDRLSKTERLAAVSSIWFLGRFTSKYEMGMQASFIDHTFQVPPLAAMLSKHVHQLLIKLLSGEQTK